VTCAQAWLEVAGAKHRQAGDTSGKQSASLLPTPDGPYPIGVIKTHLRQDYVPAVVYYPSVNNTGSKDPIPYFFDSTRRDLEAEANATINLTMIKTAARPGAVPLGGSGPWPAVILSPGFGQEIELSTSLAEQLASHGFVVVAIATTRAEIATELTDPGTTSEPAEFAKQLSPFMPKRMRRVREVLDLLEQLSPMCGMVDMRKVAVGGHSLAGYEAFLLAARDKRIAAVVNLDGWIGVTPPSPVRVPALLVTATPRNTSSQLFLTADKRRTKYVKASHIVAVGLLNANHFDVTDLPAIVSVLPRSLQLIVSGELGSIGVKATAITSTIVLRFLKAAFTGPGERASASELVAGLPSVTEDPLGLEKHSAAPSK
jgi:dienelactone hydrolase